jgi:hypothetical protein
MKDKIRQLMYKKIKKRNRKWSDLRIKYNIEIILKSSIYQYKRLEELSEDELKLFYNIVKKFF